ncbi:MAG: LysR family transcriptional regulator [Paracoccaceae bacterium]|nr:LysR family transcriptional regulator [Paracoccaceae bacterium]
MQIDLIDTFLDLVETRSFNKTADRTGVTQSTVSARISALEKTLGRRLFTRSRAGTELTTAGLRFEPHARGLKHAWTEALRAAQSAENTALAMRIGLQIDLGATHAGDWVAAFQAVLPETAFYLELDYSIQMCADLASGRLDFGVLYSPRNLPDLHFESVGEVSYRLVSSIGPERADIDPASYIRASFAPAFDAQHQRLFPELSDAPVASGQNIAVASLLTASGGAAFVLNETAQALVSEGFHIVKNAPAIPQTVYAAFHLRHRHSSAHRRLVRIVRSHFGAQLSSSRPAVTPPIS